MKYTEHSVNCFPVSSFENIYNSSLRLSPVCPEEMDWSELYPDFFPSNPPETETPRVEFADIGCGYGGLLGSY